MGEVVLCPCQKFNNYFAVLNNEARNKNIFFTQQYLGIKKKRLWLYEANVTLIKKKKYRSQEIILKTLWNLVMKNHDIFVSSSVLI